MTETSNPQRISVLIVDDHPILRAGIAALLEEKPDIEVIGQAGSGAEAIVQYTALMPDVVLLDLSLGDKDGEDVIKEVIAGDPNAKIIVLTTYGGEETIKRTLQSGAVGYLLKDALGTAIVDGVRSAATGRRVIGSEVAEKLASSLKRDPLTERELEVLHEIALGHSNKVIAADLGITESTVKIHVRHILSKLNTSDRTGAVMEALERGIIKLR